MYTKSNSFNITLEPYAQSVRKDTISTYQTELKEQNTCRICLQTCPYVQLCECRGSSMIHTSCLKQFIAKGHGTIQNKSKCQICGNIYNLVFDKKCRLSCKNVVDYFKKGALSSTLFIAFVILIIIYISYCLHLNGLKVLNENQQLILLIVGVCLIIVFVIVMIRWIYIYLFVTIHMLVDINPSRKKSVQLTHCQLNESHQYFK